MRVSTKYFSFRAIGGEPLARAAFRPALELAFAQLNVAVEAERAQEQDVAFIQFHGPEPGAMRGGVVRVKRVDLKRVEPGGSLHGERRGSGPGGQRPGLPAMTVKTARRSGELEGHG